MFLYFAFKVLTSAGLLLLYSHPFIPFTLPAVILLLFIHVFLFFLFCLFACLFFFEFIFYFLFLHIYIYLQKLFILLDEYLKLNECHNTGTFVGLLPHSQPFPTFLTSNCHCITRLFFCFSMILFSIFLFLHKNMYKVSKRMLENPRGVDYTILLPLTET